MRSRSPFLRCIDGSEAELERRFGLKEAVVASSVDTTDGERIIKAFVASFGGQSFIMPAPMIVDSPEIKSSLLSDSRFFSIL